MRDDLGMLTSSSQWMLLSRFKLSSIPTCTWVDNPSYTEKLGAQTTLENFNAIYGSLNFPV